MKSVKILLVEDLGIFRFAIKALLSRMGDFEIIGEAENGQAAIVATYQLQPDVILMDVSMPVMDGIQAAKLIRKNNSQARIIMLTANDADSSIFESFEAGADGYVLKENYRDSLELAIRTVRIGSVWLDPAIARRLLKVAAPEGQSARQKPYSSVSSAVANQTLTSQETAVLEVIAESPCSNGMCMVEPRFLDRLRRFAPGSL